jgi:hypothetical protein
MWGPITNVPLFILGRNPATCGTGDVIDKGLTSYIGVAITANYNWCIVGNISSMVKTENKKKEGLNVNVIREVLATYNPTILIAWGDKGIYVEDLPEIKKILRFHKTYHLGDLTTYEQPRMVQRMGLTKRTIEYWNRIQF